MTHIRKITEEEFNQLVVLRQRGWTYKSLAFIYGVDHSSIYHFCKTRGIERGEHEVSFDLPSVIEISQPVSVIPSILELIIRPKPSCYADYLKLNV